MITLKLQSDHFKSVTLQNKEKTFTTKTEVASITVTKLMLLAT